MGTVPWTKNSVPHGSGAFTSSERASTFWKIIVFVGPPMDLSHFVSDFAYGLKPVDERELRYGTSYLSPLNRTQMIPISCVSPRAGVGRHPTGCEGSSGNSQLPIRTQECRQRESSCVQIAQPPITIISQSVRRAWIDRTEQAACGTSVIA